METNYLAGGLSYLLMLLGLNINVIPNIRKEHKIYDSLLQGGVFGLCVYGVYDLVCASIFKDWSVEVVVAEMLWGFFIYSSSAYVSSLFSNDDN